MNGRRIVVLLALALTACGPLGGSPAGSGGTTPTVAAARPGGVATVGTRVTPTSVEVAPTTAATVIPTSAATFSPTPAPLAVANTGGDGIWLRKTPGTGDKLKAWPDGTSMVVIGADQAVDGVAWKNVRDPDGTVGWVAAQYLAAGASGTPSSGQAATDAGVTATPAPAAPATAEPNATTRPVATTAPTTVATFAPTQAAPALTPTVAATIAGPTATSTPNASTSVSFSNVTGAKPGQTASVAVTTSPEVSCTIYYVPPRGTTAPAAGLTAKVADASGHVTWSWPIDTASHTGSGAVTVSCGAATATTEITIG